MSRSLLVVSPTLRRLPNRTNALHTHAITRPFPRLVPRFSFLHLTYPCPSSVPRRLRIMFSPIHPTCVHALLGLWAPPCTLGGSLSRSPYHRRRFYLVLTPRASGTHLIKNRTATALLVALVAHYHSTLDISAPLTIFVAVTCANSSPFTRARGQWSND